MCDVHRCCWDRQSKQQVEPNKARSGPEGLREEELNTVVKRWAVELKSRKEVHDLACN